MVDAIFAGYLKYNPDFSKAQADLIERNRTPFGRTISRFNMDTLNLPCDCQYFAEFLEHQSKGRAKCRVIDGPAGRCGVECDLTAK
jgi:hypothetical protein